MGTCLTYPCPWPVGEGKSNVRNSNAHSAYEFSRYLEKPDDVSLYAAGLTPESPDHRCWVAGQRVLRHLGHLLLGRQESGLLQGLRPVRSHFGTVKQLLQGASHPSNDRPAAASFEPSVRAEEAARYVAQKSGDGQF